MVRCSDNTLYTGCTSDLHNRVRTHNKGKGGAKYTRARQPVTLVYSEAVVDMSAARKREAAIKRLTRIQKEELIR